MIHGFEYPKQKFPFVSVHRKTKDLRWIIYTLIWYIQHLADTVSGQQLYRRPGVDICVLSFSSLNEIFLEDKLKPEVDIRVADLIIRNTLVVNKSFQFLLISGCLGEWNYMTSPLKRSDLYIFPDSVKCCMISTALEIIKYKYQRTIGIVH